MQLNGTELAEAKTHISLIQKNYKKLEMQQFTIKSLEEDFKEFIDLFISRNNGDTAKQYTLNTENGELEEVEGVDSEVETGAATIVGDSGFTN